MNMLFAAKAKNTQQQTQQMLHLKTQKQLAISECLLKTTLVLTMALF